MDRRNPDPAVFTSEILQILRGRSIAEVMAATGFSKHYCSLIRLGKKGHTRGTGMGCGS